MKLVGVLLLLSTTCFGSMDRSTRVEQLEQQMRQVRFVTDNHTAGARFANGYGDRAWDIKGGFLYWKPVLDNEAYTLATSSSLLTFVNTSPAFFDLPIQGQMHGTSFNFDWGFFVGAGRRIGHDWRLNLEYLRFQTAVANTTNASDKSDVQIPDEPFTLNHNATNTFRDGNTAGPIKDQTSLSYDTISLLLESSLFLSQYLSLDWQMGLKTDWIKLKEFIRSEPRIVLQGSGTVIEPQLSSKLQSDIWEIGPCFEFDGKFHLSPFCFISGEFQGALLYQFAKAYFTYKVLNIAQEIDMHLNSSTHQWNPYMSLDLGLNFDKKLPKNTLLRLSAKYHLEHLFNAYYNFHTDDTALLGSNQSLFVPIKVQLVSDPLSFIGLTFQAQLFF